MSERLSSAGPAASAGPVVNVELAAGEAGRRGLQPGDQLVLERGDK